MPQNHRPRPARSDDLITIGVFARSSGISPSALRFYADSGLLLPAAVDETSGYRYYAPDQLDRAVTIRRLREIDMPLDRVSEVLDADAGRAAALIDEHVGGLDARVRQARAAAAEIRASLDVQPAQPAGSVRVATIRGPVLASAIDQVLSATAHDAEHPVLTGVHLETVDDCLVLTATDRYRLATRTVTLDRGGRAGWSGTADGDDLRMAASWTRRQSVVDLRTDPHGLVVDAGTGGTRVCRLLPDPFPDHRAVFDALAPVRTRVVVARNPLVRATEDQPDDRVLVRVSDGAVTVSAPGPDARPVTIPAGVRGPDTALAFEITTLYPAIATAVGPDVMLDIAAPDQPVVVRSADDGDLTTLAMPVRHEPVTP
ncbi:MerR family transcriptional regulator [Rhodococcus sp. NPDC003318]|uniref:DNA polymerase III subunit beta family protein n=1 Tax=Rhodococcus sp. NPDC003318 TaxID=3364503 RepID=UPI0036A88EFC